MSKFLITVGLMLSSLAGFSQAKNVEVKTITDKYQPYYQSNDVVVEVKKQDCDFPSDGIHQQFLLFKYENKTAETVKIDLHNDFYYNQTCKTCDSPEYNYSFELAPNQTIEATCDLQNPRYMAVFVKQNNFKSSSQLTSIELTSIQVKREEK